MVNQYQTEKMEWSVVHDDYVVPFASFESAVSYANGLAAKDDWVKNIDPERNVIRLVKSNPVSWPDEQMDELSGLTRRLRAQERD